MILFFVGLTELALSMWEGRWAWIMSMRPIFGLGIVILINVPWLVAIGLVTKGEYFTEALGQDFFGKALAPQESHWGPPGYYLLSLLVGFWPAWLFLAPGIVYGIARAREGAVGSFQPGSCSNSHPPSCRIIRCRPIPHWRCSVARRSWPACAKVAPSLTTRRSKLALRCG
jgi:hypothetical protein